jgi:hypothetical protein
MQGCIAPSEIPGVSTQEASVFGAVAEALIYADFFKTYGGGGPYELFKDDHNPASYLFFLAKNNPHFTEARQKEYYSRTRADDLMRVPDFAVHKQAEKSFYEVKPDSRSGYTAGVQKVGILSAVYKEFRLPYVPGEAYRPRSHQIASFGSHFRAKLSVRLSGPGLIQYKICAEANGTIELATLAAILALIVREVNKQRSARTFRPVDLAPALHTKQLADLAKALALPAAAGAVGGAAAAGWPYFWKAVCKRFAVRGTTAAALSVADGPLPVGELAALGLTLWTIVDIVRLRDELWRDADALKRQGA